MAQKEKTPWNYKVVGNQTSVIQVSNDDRDGIGTDAWTSLYGRYISQENYKQICQSLDGFFSTLKEWDNKAKKDGN